MRPDGPQRQCVHVLLELRLHQPVHRRHTAGILAAKHGGQRAGAVGSDGAHARLEPRDVLAHLRVGVQLLRHHQLDDFVGGLVGI